MNGHRETSGERSSSVSDRRISRRTLIRVSGAAGVAGLMPALPGCAAAGAGAGAAFNPAVTSWLSRFALSIAASAVGSIVTDELKGAWKNWTSGARAASEAQYKQGFEWTWHAYAHGVPPVLFFAVGTDKDVDPMNDRLVACVQGGSAAVVFEAWAWQALSMYVNDMTAEKEGDELAQSRALCVLSLVPSGTKPSVGGSPQGTVAWMTYQARNGIVEIARVDEADGNRSAIVSASAIPDADGQPIRKRFALPTAASA